VLLPQSKAAASRPQSKALRADERDFASALCDAQSKGPTLKSGRVRRTALLLLNFMFPIFLKLEGRPCLLVGAGRVGEGKLKSLLRAGARVKVVAPKATAGVRRLASSGKIVWLQRKFTTRDLNGMALVVAATSSHPVNTVIFRAARRRGVLCNAVDDPSNCDFYYPAVLRRGSLQIAISTGGSSPELASRLRKELESCFGTEYGPWLDYLARQRQTLLRTSMPAAWRRRLLRQLASRPAFQQFLRNVKLRKKRTSAPTP